MRYVKKYIPSDIYPAWCEVSDCQSSDMREASIALV